MQLKKLNNAGETIIEVLLCLSILGLILGVAYATTSRNLQATRDSQERLQALQYAESITESIRAYAIKDQSSAIPNQSLFPGTTGATPLIGATRTFCISVNPTDYSSAALPISNGAGSARCQRPGDTIYRHTIVAHNLGRLGGSQNASFRYAITVNWQGLSSGTLQNASTTYVWTRANERR